ncbi:hypothetical protein AGMMS50256_30560 [Betaproteobacteria bacterium]|nr:hypothetical protein AGMMS50256_30560 [Betaproteobacteria bacterium]
MMPADLPAPRRVNCPELISTLVILAIAVIATVEVARLPFGSLNAGKQVKFTAQPLSDTQPLLTLADYFSPEETKAFIAEEYKLRLAIAQRLGQRK